MAATAAASVDFLLAVNKLKHTLRTGWVLRGVDKPESVAEHMYRMGLMCLLCPDASLDRARMVRIALVHDMMEGITGDITPLDGLTKAEKHAREVAAIEELCGMLGVHTTIAGEIRELWDEYEAASTAEARWVKDCDKLEMLLQAVEYECEQGKDLGEFFDGVQGKITHPAAQAWHREVLTRRPR